MTLHKPICIQIQIQLQTFSLIMSLQDWYHVNCDMFLLIRHLFHDLTCYFTQDLFLHEVCVPPAAALLQNRLGWNAAGHASLFLRSI